MRQNKPTYDELERRCLAAEAALAAIRSGQTDVIVSEQGLLLLRLQEMEKALRESEAKFKYIFDNSNVAKSITLLDGTVQPNQAFADMLAYPLEELKGKKWPEITYPDDIGLNERMLAAISNGEAESARFNKRYLRKDGQLVWVDMSVNLRRDERGKPAYFITHMVNITELKQAEEMLKRYEMAIKQTADGIAIADMTDRMTFVNLAWANMHGYSVDEMVNQPLSINHTPAQMESDVLPPSKKFSLQANFLARSGMCAVTALRFSAR